MTTKRKVTKKEKEVIEDFEQDEEVEEEVDDIELEERVDVYKELGLTSAATTGEIKSAYRKLALKYHPDKQVGKSSEDIEESVSIFQKLTTYYECLIDPAKREIYDTTGQLPGSEVIDKDGDVSWKDFFDELTNRVTAEAIEEFEKVYRYSEEERQDVFQAYTKTKGSLLDMIDHVPLCSLADLDRFKIMCQDAIDEGELEKLKKFGVINQRDLKKKQNKLQKEQVEAEKEDKKLKAKAAVKNKGKNAERSDMGNLGDLKQMIRNGQKERIDSLADHLEKKYVDAEKKGIASKSSKKRKTAEKELNDEDFEAFQSKLFSKNKI